MSCLPDKFLNFRNLLRSFERFIIVFIIILWVNTLSANPAKLSTNDNEWQWVTTNDNEWQRAVISANSSFFFEKERSLPLNSLKLKEDLEVKRDIELITERIPQEKMLTVRSSCLSIFLKIGVQKIFCNIHRKTSLLESLLI